MKKIAPILGQNVSNNAKQISDHGIKLYSNFEDELDEEYHIVIGEKAIALDPFLIYVSIIDKTDGIHVIVFVGEEARKYGYHAGKIAMNLSIQLGGSGGGDSKFGQGGGKIRDKITEITNLAERYVKADEIG